MRLCPAGTADLLLLSNGGRPLFMEIKDAKGKQSPDQVKFQEEVQALGYRYALVRSVDEALSVL